VAMVGLSVSWKPFDWGKSRHEIDEKSLTVEQAHTAVSQTESGVAIEVGSAIRKLQESRLKLQLTKLNRETAGEHLRVSTAQYAEKAVLLKEVVQRQAELAISINRYQEALLEFWTAKADFERTIGTDQ
jgi:outer membrane protein